MTEDQNDRLADLADLYDTLIKKWDEDWAVSYERFKKKVQGKDFKKGIESWAKDIPSDLNNLGEGQQEVYKNLKELLYEGYNGIAEARGARIAFGKDKFEFFITNKQFMGALCEVINKGNEIDAGLYNKFTKNVKKCAEEFSNEYNKPNAQPHFFKNRVIAALSDKVSTVATEETLDEILHWLMGSGYIDVIEFTDAMEEFEYAEGWFGKNVFLIEELRKSKPDEKYGINCFPWLIYDYITNDENMEDDD